jgi:multiple sugar transport system substrate-binding protein
VRTTLVVLFALIAGTIAAVLPWRMLSSAAGGRTPVTFTVWGMPFEDRLFEDIYARGFEAENPGVRVDYQRHADINMKYNAWRLRGVGAEAMRIQITDYHQFVEQGMLLPLGPYIDDPALGLSEGQIARFPKALWDDMHVNGEVYALPSDMAQLGLFYNRTIFDDYNEAHPGDTIRYPDETWTWSQFRDAARKLTMRDERGRVTIHGFDMFVWQWPFMNFHVQAGGKIWSEDGLSTLVDSQAGVEALSLMAGLVADGSWRPTLGQEQGAGPDNAFATGRVAMYVDGSWRVPNFEIRNPDLDFAVAPMPQCDLPGAVPAVIGGSVLWGVSAQARHPAEGWRMIKWLIAPEQALDYWDVLRVAPPADVEIVGSQAFHTARGVPGAEPGTYDVPPMSEEQYDLRAKWLEYAMTPDPETGRAPGFVPTSRYQRALEDEIAVMLNDYLRDPASKDEMTLLRRVATNVHAVIDRDRAARGLAPAIR